MYFVIFPVPTMFRLPKIVAELKFRKVNPSDPSYKNFLRNVLGMEQNQRMIGLASKEAFVQKYEELLRQAIGHDESAVRMQLEIVRIPPIAITEYRKRVTN